jgi:hypothetical protein
MWVTKYQLTLRSISEERRHKLHHERNLKTHALKTVLLLVSCCSHILYFSAICVVLKLMPCEGCGKDSVSEYVLQYFQVLYCYLHAGTNHTAPYTVLSYWSKFRTG